MIEIIKNPSDKQFFALVKQSEKELLLCAPYIKTQVINKILSVKNKEATLEVITSANFANFVNGSLDLEAIKILLNQGIKVLNYQNLHAKIYLFDNKKALITSANLTSNGLYNNYEYGVLINEDEKKAIDVVYKDFVFMMDSELCGEFNNDVIKNVEKLISSVDKKKLIKIDEEEDEIISIPSVSEFVKQLTPWEQDVFECVNKIICPSFTLKDVYAFEKDISKKHPKNNNVKAKIRQQLQQLRDYGLIKFTERGKYKKLWI